MASLPMKSLRNLCITITSPQTAFKYKQCVSLSSSYTNRQLSSLIPCATVLPNHKPWIGPDRNVSTQSSFRKISQANPRQLLLNRSTSSNNSNGILSSGLNLIPQSFPLPLSSLQKISNSTSASTTAATTTTTSTATTTKNKIEIGNNFTSGVGRIRHWMLHKAQKVNLTFKEGSMIRSNQSALLVKRSRKKAPKIHDEGQTRQLNNVVAYALGEEIALEPLMSILQKQGLYAIGELPTDANDALLVRGIYNVEQKPKEIFVFENGSVVFWCVPEIERGSFLKLLMKYCQAPYPRAVVLSEREEMDFTYGKGNPIVSEDVIQLKEREEGREADHVLELFAFSDAMSQSVKLSAWEASLGTFVTSIETLTEDIRLGRKISMSRRELLKKSGELMSLRHFVNLSSDLLDTPDFYWDRAYLETLYQSLYGQLNIAKRTKVINTKLTHCVELVDLVSRQLSDEHHIRLEVMIIILIMVEVIFEFIHFGRDYMNSPSRNKGNDDK